MHPFFAIDLHCQREQSVNRECARRRVLGDDDFVENRLQRFEEPPRILFGQHCQDSDKMLEIERLGERVRK